MNFLFSFLINKNKIKKHLHYITSQRFYDLTDNDDYQARQGDIESQRLAKSINPHDSLQSSRRSVGSWAGGNKAQNKGPNRLFRSGSFSSSIGKNLVNLSIYQFIFFIYLLLYFLFSYLSP